jgi:beta-lactam-binding protein with PASTA domain
MLRKMLRYFLLGLVLLLVFFASALLAMRFAIHGREVRVPRLAGLTPAEAERIANADGLVLSVESRFYTPSVPEGRIVSQSPAQDTRVRRGWKVVVAESLGPQHSAIPNLVGQSEHAADINISRRRLEIRSVTTMYFPGAQPGTVVAQDPSSNAKDVISPKIGLILAPADNAQRFVMPSFIGKPLTEATNVLEKAGFTLGNVQNVQAAAVPATADGPVASTSPKLIIRQHPLPGQKVAAGTSISFEVRR